MLAVRLYDRNSALGLKHQVGTIYRVGTLELRFEPPKRPTPLLYEQIIGKVPELYLVGDALAPRIVKQAVWDGHMVGRKL